MILSLIHDWWSRCEGEGNTQASGFSPGPSFTSCVNSGKPSPRLTKMPPNKTQILSAVKTLQWKTSCDFRILTCCYSSCLRFFFFPPPSKFPPYFLTHVKTISSCSCGCCVFFLFPPLDIHQQTLDPWANNTRYVWRLAAIIFDQTATARFEWSGSRAWKDS